MGQINRSAHGPLPMHSKVLCSRPPTFKEERATQGNVGCRRSTVSCLDFDSASSCTDPDWAGRPWSRQLAQAPTMGYADGGPPALPRKVKGLDRGEPGRGIPHHRAIRRPLPVARTSRDHRSPIIPPAQRWEGTAPGLRGGGAMSDAHPGSQRLDIRRGQRLASDAPVATVDLLDEAPRDGPHVLSLDLDHCVGQPANDLLLLLCLLYTSPSPRD